CQREGVVDFAELLLRCYELLRATSRSARALPAAASAHPGRRVPGHQPAAVPVAASCWPASTRRMFAVGDDDQSIYAFRGANVGNMRDFEREFAGRATVHQARAELPLARQHPRRRQRADPRTTAARLGKNLWTERRQRRAAARCSRRHRRRGGAPASSTRSRGAAPATACALSEIALLYRSQRAVARARARAVQRRRFPTASTAGCASSSAQEVKHALAYLRLIAQSADDDGAFLRVVNFPPRGIGARTLEQLQDAAARRGREPVAGGRAGDARRQGRRRASRAFVRLIERLRARRRGPAAARDGRRT
ncbi:MAG: UvrD-helicase domain-containing protein, partial [Chromatiales bacterium]|nr:UvrD-helicase domain-containing protein [Chromatiales bacterium]